MSLSKKSVTALNFYFFFCGTPAASWLKYCRSCDSISAISLADFCDPVDLWLWDSPSIDVGVPCLIRVGFALGGS
jgi:hypothetical protein